MGRSSAPLSERSVSAMIVAMSTREICDRLVDVVQQGGQHPRRGSPVLHRVCDERQLAAVERVAYQRGLGVQDPVAESL